MSNSKVKLVSRLSQWPIIQPNMVYFFWSEGLARCIAQVPLSLLTDERVIAGVKRKQNIIKRVPSISFRALVTPCIFSTH